MRIMNFMLKLMDKSNLKINLLKILDMVYYVRMVSNIYLTHLNLKFMILQDYLT